MNYADQLTALASVDRILGEEISRLPNLEAIPKWAPHAGIPLAEIDLVQQDEYSYDLYLKMPDSRWLIFGVS